MEMTIETTAISGSLTAAQIDAYETQGYLVLENLLDAEDMAPAHEAMQQKTQQIADELVRLGMVTETFPEEPLGTRLALLFEKLTDEDFVKCGRGWRDRLPGYFHLMSNPKILDAVESLLGGELFANPVYNVRPKVPRVAAGDVPWHQDKSYWPDASANPVITVWLALVEANLQNGCLQLIPRTHRKKLLSSHAETYSGTGFIQTDEEHIANSRDRAIAIPLPPGGAVLFNDRLIHMSMPNLSDVCRWSVDLRYQNTLQDRMPQHGAGFLARSYQHPERVAKLDDWLANRCEHEA